jgi:HTH-type transcriptional regulator / antitoxin HipB
MIQNEHQYRITQTKLRELEQELAAINPQSPNMHTRQIVGWTNSLNMTIRQLKQEISEYQQLKQPRSPGLLTGEIGNAFFEPLPEEELQQWE